jgi:hypothetical protein
MSRSSRTCNKQMSETMYCELHNLLQSYRSHDSSDNDTTKEQEAVLTIINDFTILSDSEINFFKSMRCD